MAPPARSARPSAVEARAASPALIAAGLGIVYVLWGSTYLAIRVAVRTLPPFLMGSVRWLIAGAVLYAVGSRRGDRADRPTARHWRSAFVIGAFLILGGNGTVSWAEQRVPSNITALLIATVPLWIALAARTRLGERLRWQAVLGIAVGLAGIALLVQPSGTAGVDALGAAMILLASASWAWGSVWSVRAPLPSRPLLGAGMEMLAGGLLLAVVGVATGEVDDVRLSAFEAESLLAVGYLIVFGSIAGFTTYVWLLRVTRASLVSTHAYVNPVVAVVLGWAILDEAVTARTLAGGGIIVLAVALIVGARAAPAAGEPAADVPAIEELAPLAEGGEPDGDGGVRLTAP